MSAVPAFAAAMVAILLQLPSREAVGPLREEDETVFWLVAATLALLVR